MYVMRSIHRLMQQPTPPHSFIRRMNSLEITGQKTVPNVFVNGKHIGGCDDTLAAIASGVFKELIAA